MAVSLFDKLETYKGRLIALIAELCTEPRHPNTVVDSVRKISSSSRRRRD